MALFACSAWCFQYKLPLCHPPGPVHGPYRAVLAIQFALAPCLFWNVNIHIVTIPWISRDNNRVAVWCCECCARQPVGAAVGAVVIT